MSLADELLNDFEDVDDELLDNEIKAEIKEEPVDDAMDVIEDPFKVPFPVNSKVKGGLTTVRQVAKLWDSDRLKNIKEQVEKYSSHIRKAEDLKGPVETDSEYQLIVEANNISVDIDNDICIIHKFVRDKYSKRFPELESLVINPQEYLYAVRELGNDVDKVKNSEVLGQFLTQATIMVVSVTASATQGAMLTNEELDAIEEACTLAQDLSMLKMKIFEYVESRMNLFVPNLTAVVGSTTAAKLLGSAGGLTNLSKMPSCNVLVVGKEKKSQLGLSQTSIKPHTGHIYYCQFVQEIPPDFRSKVARLIANKATVAGRIDSLRSYADGSQGLRLREEIEKKVDKMLEPPPVKAIKPLPPPIDVPGKKRGGRSVRKMKERMAVTDFRKAANRMTFGEMEEDTYQDDLGYTRGQIGKGGAGRIRKVMVDEKTRVRLSKSLQKEVARQNVYAAGGQTTVRRQVAGTSSSVAFTPLQGLEIVNPHAAENNNSKTGNRYFSNLLNFKSRKS
uniref:U4/U6 small nuclear ribonucleoprotein Prp31 n=1 Tax=Hirondellea gigas TaxID=1518452 RepID=A0A2P2HWN6_9CRUS